MFFTAHPKEEKLKKIVFLISISLLILCFSRIVSAEDKFQFQVSMGILITNKADNLWGDGYQSLTSLQRSPKAASKIIPFPVFDIKHIRDKGGTEFYLNTTTQEAGSLALGARKRFNKSLIDAFGFVSLISKAWKNPYVLDRDRTTSREYGGKITYYNIFDTNINLSYRIQQTDISDDVIGDINRDLKRDGSAHAPGISYTYKIGERYMFMPGFTYEKGRYKGASNSYDSYELSLGFIYNEKDLNVITRAFRKRALFDKIHPVFGETREEDTYGLSAMINIINPFGFKKYFFSVGAVATETYSNITFFDKYGIVGFVRAGYQF
ncbi:MAG TPA: DUF2860 family protein [Syntrophorhabdaceae bacterium]|nr:DUF2860 family protein [Syntrophorhabdaceae bacterium]HOL05979.1 DUF2860 family protein [Syntrophorhabdaceae bacterium]HON84972.1 DUF2860 family protein [Syntrophorhabdaceae bacterium]HOT41689.1 DUF2860 family protein [Syntrophorhabdaceae bacterium]HPC66619.1 DUF2860 family protein [Syntrophorhabdaceae bacterium]